jgi:hypothetical protein
MNGTKAWSPYKGELEAEIIALWKNDLADSPWPDLFKPALPKKIKPKWLKSKVYELFPGAKGRSARLKRDIVSVFERIRAGEGKIAESLL